MADTQPMAPTDAEIFAVAREAGLLPDNSHPAPETRAARKHSDAVRAFARAALAKWGAQPVARDPLTEKQIDDYIRHADAHGRYGETFARGIRWGIRHYERAHGIGIKNGDSHGLKT